MEKRSVARMFAMMAAVLYLAACARTVVRPDTGIQSFGLPRPNSIMVYDFAVTEADLTRGQKSADYGTAHLQGERQQDAAMQAANAFGEELVSGLRGLGFTVERVPRGTPVSSRDLLIDGAFLDVDTGSTLKRLVIGFGSGASKVDTDVQVYYGSGREKLIDFRTHADSGKMPGAAATMGAGGIVTGGITAGMAATGAAMGAVKEYHSETERMAAGSADQAIAYLSEFFARQGWIAPDQVKRAKLEK
jgi:hypothetical protein